MTKELVTVFLKSGHEITFKCDGWEFKRDSNTSYTGYSLKGFEDGEFYSFDTNEIAGYKVKTINE